MAKLKIYYDMQQSVWKVRTIVDEHNHELAPAMFTNLLPSHRKMSEGDKAQVDSFKQFGIPTSKIMAYMAGQSGGYTATIGYLEGKANVDMMTSARYTQTSDNRLGSLFWADGEMMADYQLFGDVLAFDSTYHSNKYRKPLVVFFGSNHHKQTSIFGFALLEDEEVHTYQWVLLNLLDVMGHKKPCVVVTDGDKAMRAAIAEVIPTTKHRLCCWHLEKNCVQRVKETEFCKVFQKVLYANLDINEFEDFWKTLVESLGLQDNIWVQSTYDSRESWAMAYLRGTFCAVYRTTSRCEGINAFVKGFLRSTDSILELVHSLDQVVKDYRNNEVMAQFYSTYYTPVLTTGLDSIELFASKVYTRAVFREVKKQIKGVATLLFQGRDVISMTCVYKFSKMRKPNRTYKVLYDPNEERIDCECSMWNSEGIPCSHIFYAIKYEGLEKIPGGLILSRWCKDAKEWRSKPPESTEGHQGRLLRYGALCGAMSVVAKLGAEDANEFVVARDGISRLTAELQRRAYNKLGGPPGLSSLSGLKDPVVSKTKGAPRKGKEMHFGSEGERDHGVAGTDACVVYSSAECSSAKPSAPYTAGRTQDADKDGGIQSENGDNRQTVPDCAETTSTRSMHGCSLAHCSPHMGVGGEGSNIFLGGQHIE
ncbi:protein FAR1-RELATED SEQUENCE 5-like [Arachis duranensis]|uniref:Protein FAR1-RELATED SEQUENCE 5-like n=1 Tax=Arachis duranensis TaxID=130453 RepID=A0A9C6WLG3_ARADU|nr:protein FAR1-RELATED SEQUENCE 5-like [Arachis duranensis]